MDLLGESRAAIVRHVRDVGEASVAELAEMLDLSTTATRKHVDRLLEDGLLTSRTVNPGRGRPVARWSLTEAGRQLFPQRTDDLASELLDYLADRGRDELGAYLRWRQQRQVADYARSVDADDVEERLRQLADRLSAQGYRAEVTTDGDALLLRQTHCTIESVAREQPLLCTTEAAAFGRVLGDEVRVTRRETLARGDDACVCHVQLRAPTDDALPVVDAGPDAPGSDSVGGAASCDTTGHCATTDLPTTHEDAT